jgi:hypothetical protein
MSIEAKRGAAADAAHARLHARIRRGGAMSRAPIRAAASSSRIDVSTPPAFTRLRANMIAR